jgi:uncharacterized protein (TIGR02466 family)
MKNVFRDTLFTNFLYSAEIEIDVNSLIDECYKFKAADNGVTKSNKNGWQSKTTKESELVKSQVFEELTSKCLNFAQVVSESEQLNYQLNDVTSWVNINHPNSYNMPHTHNDAILSGCFYAKVPENSGELSFVRTDAASCALTFSNKPSESSFILKPMVGRIYIFPPWLMHLVSLNESSEDRVSIAMNFTVIK